jgi:hypothetical protein
MKTRVVRIFGTCVLLVGMAYAVLGVTSQPVRASSCDCDLDDEEAAAVYCSQQHPGSQWRVQWTCPYGTGSYEVWCEYGNFVVIGPFVRPCQDGEVSQQGSGPERGGLQTVW